MTQIRWLCAQPASIMNSASGLTFLSIARWVWRLECLWQLLRVMRCTCRPTGCWPLTTKCSTRWQINLLLVYCINMHDQVSHYGGLMHYSCNNLGLSAWHVLLLHSIWLGCTYISCFTYLGACLHTHAKLPILVRVTMCQNL